MNLQKQHGRVIPKSGLNQGNGALHEIDFEDVSISAKAVTIIRRAVRTVMEQHMPGSRPEGMTAAQAIAMFLDRLYWDSANGGLLMCMEVADKTFCLPIPKEHWSIRPTGLVQ